MIVAPQAFNNGIEVLTPIVIAHAKDHSDVDQMLTRNQIMEYASKDNYDDICVDSAHIDSLLPLLQGMHHHKPSHDYSFARGCFHQWKPQLALM